MPTTVQCPTCKKSILWLSTNPFRPFCSERCKNIDLGAWASEAFRIPITETSNPINDTEHSI